MLNLKEKDKVIILNRKYLEAKILIIILIALIVTIRESGQCGAFLQFICK
jgi:hypothetical protein